MSQLVSVRQLSFRYNAHNQPRGHVRDDEWTLKNLDLSFERGTTVGIVGESGSGKSTLVNILCGLLPINPGTVTFDGRDLSHWLHESPQAFRRANQIVFQNPASSFDPRMRIGQSLAQPIKALERRRPSKEEMISWLARVGVGAEALPRYPHQLSGGQLQRLAVARALSVDPSVLYADEPTSSLDVSVQAQVLNLLLDLQTRLGLTLIMVSHDLAVISRLCEQVVVMRNGKIVENGASVDVLRTPTSAYTANLIKAAETVSLANAQQTGTGDRLDQNTAKPAGYGGRLLSRAREPGWGGDSAASAT